MRVRGERGRPLTLRASRARCVLSLDRTSGCPEVPPAPPLDLGKPWWFVTGALGALALVALGAVALTVRERKLAELRLLGDNSTARAESFLRDELQRLRAA